MNGKNVLRQLRQLKDPRRVVWFPRRQLGLHSIIGSAGWDRQTGPGYDWHGLKRGKAKFTLFQYTISGRGHLQYEDKEYICKPGSAMLLFFPYDNHYWAAPGEKWEFFYLCIRGQDAMQAWRFAIERGGPLWQLGENDKLVQTAAKLCLRTLRDELSSPWQASSCAYDLSMRLMEQVEPTIDNPNPQRSEGVERAIEFARENYARPIGVDEMAAAAGLSRYHFSRIFHQEQGSPPGEYIAQVRLRQAAVLLQTTDQPVKSVAFACGFADCGYFGKAFRREYGMTPASFRKSGMY